MNIQKLAVVLILLSTWGFSFTVHAKPSVNKSKTTIVSLNKADATTLAKAMKGVGKKRAEAIVAYRATHGRFKSFAELERVKGISAKTIKRYQATWAKRVRVRG